MQEVMFSPNPHEGPFGPRTPHENALQIHSNHFSDAHILIIELLNSIFIDMLLVGLIVNAIKGN